MNPRPDASRREAIAKADANHAVNIAKSAIHAIDLGDTAGAQRLLRNLIKQLAVGQKP